MSSIGIAGNILKTLETSSSMGMFIRDTGGCLISRLALSRSNDETREISIAEITESSLFYFSAPLLAKGMSDIFSKTLKVDKNIMTKPINELKDINEITRKKVKLGKFGQIASTFSLILPAVFAIAPVRNMVTLGKTGKEEFVNVVELDKTKQKEKKDEAQQKAKKLGKILGVTAMGLLGSTIGIIAGAKKNKNFYKKIEPLIDKTIKHFDFTKSADLELMHYGALIYPVSIAGYFYASRDKYEVQENARRFSVTVPLLFFGEKLIQNPIHKFADKKFGTNIFSNGEIKSYDDIMKLDKPIRKKSIKAKNIAYGSTFFINTFAIAMGVALLNRFETKRRYELEHKNDISFKNNKIKENSIWQSMKI